jgi:hypothetical protein
MQEQPLEAVRSASRRPRAVHGITGHGMTDRVEMDADLVRPAGHEVQLQQRPAGEPLPHPVAGRRGPPVGDHRHPGPVLRIAPDPCLDPTHLGGDLPEDEGEVCLLDPARLQLGHQRVLGGVRPGDHQQAARVAVEAMDDPGPLNARDATEPAGRMGEQRVDQAEPVDGRDRQ